MKAIKFLVSGFESSGKSTITSKIKDALIINFDGKEYNLPNTISADFKEYNGVESFSSFIIEKLQAYNKAYKKPPKFLVLDTITSLYAMMAKYNKTKFKGFDVFNANESDTLFINSFLENTIIGASNVSVVIVAHAMWDETKNCYVIPAEGKFKHRGSWQSYVNDSIFIDKSNNKRQVYTKSLKYIARTSLFIDDNEEIVIPVKEYDINKHLNDLIEKSSNDKSVVKL